MPVLNVRLFGKFFVECDAQTVTGFDARKVQELLCYLLLHRNRPHPRETLANLLCADCSTSQSRKRLRQALWKLQTALDTEVPAPANCLFLVEPEWIRINPETDFWLDVASFEEAFARTEGVPGPALEPAAVQALRGAVELYRGDLLEGWYQDWCLYERERLQRMYLAMLDKLMGFCEAHQDFEAGIRYGEQILQHDRAHERTHRRLMRLHYLAGDRTAALQQYRRCAAALAEELAVSPSQPTVILEEQIRADLLSLALSDDRPAMAPRPAAADASPCEILARLKHTQVLLAHLQSSLEQDIHTLEARLNLNADCT